jgi:peptide/nickel transport system substrate-binding protein
MPPASQGWVIKSVVLQPLTKNTWPPHGPAPRFGDNREMVPEGSRSGPGVQVFLIADIRGYTRFTQDHGDAAAAELASKFAAVVAEVVAGHGGQLMELRGDEALVSFGSPRLALTSAVALQRRLLDETKTDPRLPLGVGIGIDVGEAVPVDEGYRGSALNVAARLCARAAPGEIFATREVAHLARTIPEVRYQPQRSVVLKGLDAPIDVVKVVAAREDLAASFQSLLRPTHTDEAGQRRVRRRRLLLGAGLATVATIGGTLALTRSSGDATLDIRGGVGLVDAESSRLVTSIEVPSGAVAIAPDGVWVAEAGGNTISKVDANVDRVVETVEVGPDPAGLTFGFDALWVANAGGASLSRVNTETNSVVQTVEVGNAPSGVAVGEGSVWVANRFDDSVSRVDPSDGRVTATIVVDDDPESIAVHDGYVWVANQSASTVSKIDPASNDVTKVIRVGNGPGGIAVAGDAVWVTNTVDGTASRIDTDTDTVTTTLPVGESPSAIAATGNVVWVASEDDATLTKIDAHRGERIETLSVGGTPTALTATGGSVWVSVSGSLGHGGGTLRVVGSEGSFNVTPGYSVLDPAVAYGPSEWKILTVTNDGLVEFKRVGGADGTTIVPNLAVSMPSTAEDGRSYTFELREGVRYSTGEAVVPSDVRSSIERVVRIGTVEYFDVIAGAARCRPTTRCDLSRGIVVDDEANTVTFNLTRADPEFLYKLALPFGSVVPEGTPDRLKPGETVVATGPYRISDYRVKERLHLVRNEYFKPWAPAAQPEGYAEEIDIELSVVEADQIKAVREGRADVMLDAAPPGSFPKLRTRFADQLHIQPSASSFYMFLNTREAPFDQLDVRRAVNFAVDREHIAELFGGAPQATLSCQILPPNFPGYRRWCRYTDDPNAGGVWSAPDLATAQRLVARSGTAGTRIDILEPRAIFPTGLGRYFEGLLDSLGFDARLRRIDDGVYFPYVHDSGNHVQIGPYGWIMDYPAPSNFFLAQFRCADFKPNNPFNINVSAFCDRSIDRMIASALKKQGEDPSEAVAEWTAVDRAIMEEAPIVPMINGSEVQFVSDRVGNVVIHPIWGLVLEQLWVS